MAALTVSCNMIFCVLCMQCNALYYTVLEQMGGSRKYPYHGWHLRIPKGRGGLRRLEFRGLGGEGS